MTDLAHDASWLRPPPDWRVTRLGYVSTAIQTGPFGSQLHADDYVDGGIPLINPSHIRDGNLRPNGEDSVSQATAHRLGRHRMRAGEVVFGRRGELGRCAVVQQHHAGWLCGTGSMVVRPISTVIDPEYLQLAASLTGAREWLQLQSVGSTMDNLNASILGRLPIPLPAIGTQRRIVSWLRKKTSDMEALVAKKERLIELLQERRQALITEAVTKGLDPSVPMRDSGVDWLGRVPKNWTVLPLRRLLRGIEQGWSPESEDRPADAGEWAVLKLSAVSKGRFRPEEQKALPAGVHPERRYEVRAGDLLLTRANTPLLVGDACFVESTPPRLMLPDLIYRLAVRRDLAHPDYLARFLLSAPGRAQVMADARGSSMTMAKVSGGHIRAWLVPLPSSLNEQAAIVGALDAGCSKIDELVGKLKTHIEKLREYRQALVSAAVTGQLDLPMAAA